ncbi:MAG: ECF-type sigma factor [Planctomycetales bacterium]|nr:ECF-type sigma factor [Planctomycetales bacterium]
MTDDLSGSVSILFQQIRAGDAAAVARLWDRFRLRLTALAEQALSGRWKRMADAEDALQSAFISFWQRAERGDFGDEMTRDDLWNVLGTITVRKALRQQRRESAQKRGGGRVRDEADLHEVASSANSPEFDVVCAEMLELLEPDLRSYALLRLMGHKNREIADQFSCTERKVERKLQLIRAVWDEEVARWTE